MALVASSHQGHCVGLRQTSQMNQIIQQTNKGTTNPWQGHCFCTVHSCEQGQLMDTHTHTHTHPHTHTHTHTAMLSLTLAREQNSAYPANTCGTRSEERRVGREYRSR